MAIRQLRLEGDPILRKMSRPVKEIDKRIKDLLDDMVETMYEDRGVGLAAPQVGILRRLIVVDVGEGPYKMVNPEIIDRSDEEQLDIEGCLSVPNLNGTVLRPEKVRIRYQDEEGQDRELEASGLFARCICHEIDHLDGILFRDRIDRIIDMENPTEEMVAYLRDHGLMEQEAEADAEDSGEGSGETTTQTPDENLSSGKEQ